MPRSRALIAVFVSLLAAVGLSTPAQAAPAPWPPPAPVVDRVETRDPVFFVTIDDGWYHDPAAARILLDRRIPASLFLLPDATSYDTGYFRNLVDNGPSRIENHSLTHPDLTGLDEAGQRAELCGARSRHLVTFGQEPRLTRPPYGAFDERTRTAARACGSKAVVTWTHDQTTWGTPPAPPALKAGDIVLLHFTPSLAADLARVMAAADSAGLKAARLRDYIPD
ncbi:MULTISPECIES: polysaccharide deacetylase family protein [Streptomyces]|uniref:Polysaccharide deacetylase family protein n=1 Tax=Streptomyces tsukubensis (strain DSM 42081 / NBRC 108919 / NRRL 18488 / 9993) TaxID=1114943 RepID=I2MTE1_STRT9|nr:MULTISPECIES: polysaccharide deacetylase family protein [Streptomyces]AZK92630.1 hydrolase [Streptomyces tsukubensis]EIF88038.1 putative hydrolase [Streptomyces tsukubensis NRRL18488]MYS64138.1 polysaccharide deacetylase family protein [Streptomyces sp. SID5473]QKM71197.1 polysaccharide deacetylase family protein [Streptomyces tsukubensis NRRL18488]TAI40614.1 polysaccharide deacetylase family protein [Streptomyces tsukubensis]